MADWSTMAAGDRHIAAIGEIMEGRKQMSVAKRRVVPEDGALLGLLYHLSTTTPATAASCLTLLADLEGMGAASRREAFLVEGWINILRAELALLMINDTGDMALRHYGIAYCFASYATQRVRDEIVWLTDVLSDSQRRSVALYLDRQRPNMYGAWMCGNRHDGLRLSRRADQFRLRFDGETLIGEPLRL